MLEWIERRTKSAYLRKLEDDNRALTEQVRQLMNSILAAHGMGQLSAPSAGPKNFVPLRRMDWIRYKRQKEQQAAAAQAPAEQEKQNA